METSRRLGDRITRLGLLAVLLLIGSCQQPTSDPDQAVRDLITAHHWISDPVYQPTPDGPEFQAIFSVGGALNIGGKADFGSWSYANGDLTIKYYDNNNPATGTLTTETTSSPTFAVTKTTLQFTYLGGLCHLIPLP